MAYRIAASLTTGTTRRRSAPGSTFLALNVTAIIAALLLQFLTTPVLLGDEQRVLVPVRIGFETQGAHGSVWTGELVFHNRGTTTAFVQNVMSAYLCQQCQPSSTLSPGKTGGAAIPFPSMLYVTPTPFIPTATTEVSYSARVFDRSRQSTDWGTEIPLVDERDFREGRVVLVNVPVSDGFRQTLRVYEPKGKPSTAAVIKGQAAYSGSSSYS